MLKGDDKYLGGPRVIGILRDVFDIIGQTIGDSLFSVMNDRRYERPGVLCDEARPVKMTVCFEELHGVAPRPLLRPLQTGACNIIISVERSALSTVSMIFDLR